MRRLLLRDDVPLLTLTGAGGVGKTRLALAAAARATDAFADGTIFVPLAPLRDPALVVDAIAGALDVREAGGQPLRDLLIDALWDKRRLLVLDNFEQVAAAAPAIADLLAACPQLTVLATSRAPLHLRGEREFRVEPLALPDLAHLPDPATLAVSPAVALFRERAVAVQPDFALTEENAAAVAAICHRLDGLPLALELAAARVKTLSPEALLARLGSRLRLLTGGARDLPDRQRTLRDTLAWSDELLDVAERRLFYRLGLFTGGCTLEAAVAVAADEAGAAPEREDGVLDGMTSLIDTSLLRRGPGPGGEPRYAMLETIREYALDRLAADGEMAAIRRRHAEFFLGLTERAAAALAGPAQAGWLDRLATEYENLRGALDWLTRQDRATDAGLRLVGLLAPFWEAWGYLAEGRAWLEEALAHSPDGPAALRAGAFDGAGRLAFRQGDYDAARALAGQGLALAREARDERLGARTLATLANVALQRGDHEAARAGHEESLALGRRTGDRAAVAHALARLGGIAWDRGEYARSRALLEEALALRRQMGDLLQIAHSLYSLGHIAWCQGDLLAARALNEEGLALGRALADPQVIAHAQNNLGLVARSGGDYDAAHARLEESLAIARDMGDRWLVAMALGWLGYVAWQGGDDERAGAAFRESLMIARERGMKRALALALAGLAGLIGGGGRPEAGYAGEAALHRSARMLGATRTLLEGSGLRLDPDDERVYEANIENVRARLDEATFADAWATGRGLPLDQVLVLALSG